MEPRADTSCGSHRLELLLNA